MTENDWRLQGQERYLTGITLIRRTWHQSRPHWDHDHCEFCWAKFAASDGPDILREGWTTPDEYRWICDVCFADYRDRFAWRVVEAPEP
jgi:hypothetical protein